MVSCYQGEIICIYDDLVKVFGKPTNRNLDKSSVEWCFYLHQT